MSDPIPGNPDRFKLGQGADPPELKLLLLPLGDDSALREAMTRAFYGIMEGAPNSINVQHAVLLSGLVHAYKTAVDLQAQSAAKLNGTNGAPSPGGIPRGET